MILHIWRHTLRCLSVCLVSLMFLSCGSPGIPQILKIGLVAPFEGEHRAIGYDAIYAARLAIREINESGQLDGWRLELAAYDDRGDRSLATRVAGDLVTDPDVVAVIGHYRPDTSAVAVPVYADGSLAFIEIGGWGDPSATTWNLNAAPDALATAMIGVAGGQEAASTIWGNGAVADALASRSIPRSNPTAESDDISVVFSALSPVDSGESVRMWRRRSWSGRLIGEIGLASSSFGQVAGSDAAGAEFVTPYPFPQDLEGTSAWIDAYMGMGLYVSPPGPYALPTYEAVYLIADTVAAALDQGLSPDRAAMLDVVPDIRRSGWLGEISWDGRRYWREAPLYLYRWIGDEPELVERLP